LVSINLNADFIIFELQFVLALFGRGFFLEQFRNIFIPELENILLVVFLNLQLVSNLEYPVLVGSQRRPSHIDRIRDGRSRYTCLGKVGQQGSKDVPGELGISGRHGQVLAPDVRENVLQIIPVGYTHVDLFTLQINNGILSTVFEKIFISRYAVVGQDLRETIGAAGVHEVGEEIDVLGPELILVLEVHVDEVPLTDLPGDGVQLRVVVGDDGQDSGELVIDEVVIILAIVEGVQGQSVEERTFVLGLAYDKWHLGKLALEQKILGGVGEHVSINAGSEPTRE